MAVITLDALNPTLVHPATGKTALIGNRDTDNTIIWATDQGSVYVDAYGNISPDANFLDPLEYLTVDGNEEFWAMAQPGMLSPGSSGGNQGGTAPGIDTTPTAQIIVTEGVTSWVPSAALIADAIAESGLAIAIAQQLAGTGFSLFGNPKPIYNVGGGGSTGPVGAFGCTNIAQTGTVDQAIINWEHNVGRTINCRKIYFSLAEGFPTWSQLSSGSKQYLQACIDEQVQCWVCYNPNANPVTASDGAAMVASLQSFVTQGVPVRGAVFIQENWQFGNGGPAGPQPWMTIANFKLIYQTHYPTLHAAGFKVMVDFGGQEPNQIPNWDPGAAFYDVVGVDYYFGNFAAGKTIATTVALAQAGNKPLAVPEMGNSSAAGSQGPPQATVIAAINYLTSVAQAQITAGFALDAWMWYQVDGGTGPNIISSPTDYRVPALQALADTVTQQGATNAVTIAAGASLTLPALTPSPNAGFAPANGLSYDSEMSFIAGASSTNPFCTVQFTWYTADDAASRRTDRQKFHVPMAQSTSNGTVILGKGPQAGQYLEIKITNQDSVTCTISAQVNSTGRNVFTHHWYWDSSSSSVIPGFNAVAGADYANSLGSLSSQSIPASSSKSWLMSLFQGSVWFRAHADTGGVVTVQLQAQPTVSFGTGNMLIAQLPAPPAEYDNIVIMPRGPVLVTFVNSDTAAHTISMQANILEVA